MFDKWKTLIGGIQIWENINGKENDWIYMFNLTSSNDTFNKP